MGKCLKGKKENDNYCFILARGEKESNTMELSHKSKWNTEIGMYLEMRKGEKRQTGYRMENGLSYTEKNAVTLFVLCY